MTPWDAIGSINDSQVATIKALKAEIDKRRFGDGVSLGVVRGSREGRLTR
ncbi:hypothetical protein ISS39_11140 [Candidatus Bathyarchaeota archaeon]|nr:hypothetical protein [Candidatus Bathyarchaeota archaeon]